MINLIMRERKRVMINIEFFDNNILSISEEFKKLLNQAFNSILKYEDLEGDFEVSISFIDPLEIKDLNAQYRDKDKTTDVLSFPIFSNPNEINTVDILVPIELGDIFLNVDQAKKQALEYGNTLEYEILYLLIHSFLHLLGYDHLVEEDKKEMRQREKETIRLLDLSNVKL